MSKDLNDARQAAADTEFETYDPEGAVIEAMDGWEFSTPGEEWSRTLYFQNSENPDGPTTKGHFTIVFEKDSDLIKDAYASINGNDVGRRASPPAPAA